MKDGAWCSLWGGSPTSRLCAKHKGESQLSFSAGSFVLAEGLKPGLSLAGDSQSA